MEIQEHPKHPLVEKALRGWLELAAEYGVEATVERGEEHAPTAVSIRFKTGFYWESAGVSIYPPSKPGRTVRQYPLICTYFLKRGKMAFGARPRTTLRHLRNQIVWSWSPTASERLAASIAAIEAREAVAAR